MDLSDLHRTGVYALVNIVNGKMYIGSASQSFIRRWRLHRYCLKNNNHHSRYLQHSWNKHGSKAFKFRVLSFCPPHLCLEREQQMLDKYKTYLSDRGYNTCRRIGSRLGVKSSKSTIEKIKAWANSIENIQRLRRERVGVPLSEEHRKAIGKGRRGIKHSEESKVKMSLAKKGKPWTQARRNAQKRRLNHGS